MSTEYPKINSLYKRSADGRRMLFGEWSEREFEYLKDNTWVFTEKVDGTNIRVDWQGATPAFGGKTDAAQIPAPIVAWLLANITSEKLDAVFPVQTADDFVTLYGEGYGPKIQSGDKYRTDAAVVLFDVRVGHMWLRRDDVADIAHKLGIESVPTIGVGTLADLHARVEAGFESTWGAFTAEGIVARPAVELQSRMGRRIITKLKHKDFSRRGGEQS